MIPPSADTGLKLHRGGAFGEVSNSAPHWDATPEQCVSLSGTPLAIKYITSGVPALFAPRPSRGGARNRANRESVGLTAAQMRGLIAAAAHAKAVGLPFTRFVSVHWEAAGVPLPDMPRATGRFLDLLTKALARHGSRTAWLFIHENGPGKGAHVHILAHIPPNLVAVVTRLQRGWLKSITGQAYKARVIHSRPVGGRLGLETANPDAHAANLATAMAYVLKGADGDAAATFDLPRLAPGGRILGKRCGTSQNIGPAARRK